MSMHTTETNRCLTDAELDDVNGGVVAVVSRGRATMARKGVRRRSARVTVCFSREKLK
jgi:hypothetical protein